MRKEKLQLPSQGQILLLGGCVAIILLFLYSVIILDELRELGKETWKEGNCVRQNREF